MHQQDEELLKTGDVRPRTCSIVTTGRHTPILLRLTRRIFHLPSEWVVRQRRALQILHAHADSSKYFRQTILIHEAILAIEEITLREPRVRIDELLPDFKNANAITLLAVWHLPTPRRYDAVVAGNIQRVHADPSVVLRVSRHSPSCKVFALTKGSQDME